MGIRDSSTDISADTGRDGSQLGPNPIQAPASPGYWQTVLRRLRRDPVTIGAALVIVLLLLLALLGSSITPADPYASSILKRLKPIGFAGHPLGTDELGRDMLTRLMVGARLSLCPFRDTRPPSLSPSTAKTFRSSAALLPVGLDLAAAQDQPAPSDLQGVRKAQVSVAFAGQDPSFPSPLVLAV